jgi:hypothetical protein
MQTQNIILGGTIALFIIFLFFLIYQKKDCVKECMSGTGHGLSGGGLGGTGHGLSGGGLGGAGHGLSGGGLGGHWHGHGWGGHGHGWGGHRYGWGGHDGSGDGRVLGGIGWVGNEAGHASPYYMCPFASMYWTPSLKDSNIKRCKNWEYNGKICKDINSLTDLIKCIPEIKEWPVDDDFYKWKLIKPIYPND